MAVMATRIDLLLCPYLAVLEEAPTTAKWGDEKNVLAAASVDILKSDMGDWKSNPEAISHVLESTSLFAES
jgi:hypothetical protein